MSETFEVSNLTTWLYTSTAVTIVRKKDAQQRRSITNSLGELSRPSDVQYEIQQRDNNSKYVF